MISNVTAIIFHSSYIFKARGVYEYKGDGAQFSNFCNLIQSSLKFSHINMEFMNIILSH